MLGIDQLLLLVLELRHLLVERLHLAVSQVFAFARRPRQVLTACGYGLARLLVELDRVLFDACLLQLQTLLGGHDVGDSPLDVLQLLELLLIAVIQRLRGVLGPVKQV